ncbi:MAG: hypothetical protein VST70_04400 [Nitrospirota bacterium]|nr:hypothetical protein [Nitrospirota bacterium]
MEIKNINSGPDGRGFFLWKGTGCFRPRFFLLTALSIACLLIASCATLDKNAHYPEEPGTLYRTSMMDSMAYRHLTIVSRQCSKRYLSIIGEKNGSGTEEGPVLRIRIERNWPADFDLSRRRAVIPMKALIEKKEEGHWKKRKVRGYVEFRDLSLCRIRRAAFVPSEDSSILEPPLWILNVAPRKKTYWTPRLVILTAYRSLLNETLSIVGPIPFRTSDRFYYPNALINGVVQRKDLLRGVTPPDFYGNISSSLWLKGKGQKFTIMGEGDSGLFEMRSAHTKGVGVFLPYPRTFYRYPKKSYRFALSGSLLVDGPFAVEGSLDFDDDDKSVRLKGRINEAGSVVTDFQIQVPFRKGSASRFGIPGEVDFDFSFNHRRIILVLLPDSNRNTYWIGSLNQNIFGIADPT